MAAEAARVLEYPGDYNIGTAAPAYDRPESEFPDYTLPREEEAARTIIVTADRYSSQISLFSVLGGAAAAVLMIFVLIANVRYNEISNERLRLETQLSQLSQQERKLEIEFESVIDMKAVEQYARDVLGMSKPDADQISVINRVPEDRVEILSSDTGDEGMISGLGRFISSLAGYFKIGD